MNRHLLYLLGLWLLLIWLIGPGGDFPLNDDWQYAYPVKQLVEQGRFEMQGRFAPNIVLQVVWGWLFCAVAGKFSFVALRISTLVITFIGFVGFYRWQRLVGVEKNTSLATTALLMLSPMVLVLSFSFMTDVPFLALCIWSIWAYWRHLELGHWRDLILATALAIGAFLIRQPGIIIPVLYGLILLWHKGLKRETLLVSFGLVAISVATYLGFEAWAKTWMGIDDNYVPTTHMLLEALVESPVGFVVEIAKKLLKTVIYMGFFCMPLLPWLWGELRERGWLSGAYLITMLLANVLLLLVLVKVGKTFPFGGNMVYNFGLGPELLSDVYEYGYVRGASLPQWLLLLIQYVCQVAGCWMMILIGSRWLESTGIQKKQISFLLLVNAVYVPLMSITSFFDRYLLLPIASVILLLVMGERLAKFEIKRHTYWLIPACLLTIYSICGSLDYMQWNRAKHQAFTYLQDQKIPITQIDAGYEYNGWYNYHADNEPDDGEVFWWVDEDIWRISFGPVENYKVVKAYPYMHSLHLSRDSVYVLKRL